YQEKIYTGRGVSTDIIEASTRAFINAVNKVAWEKLNYQQRSEPDLDGI
ncbi:MAG TPA: hypothetical protein DEB05_13170, partial [Firmicutes bacterium]|nr:hypothetical protein [Bacillota bacterium]